MQVAATTPSYPGACEALAAYVGAILHDLLLAPASPIRLAPGAPLAVALSGGADSLALTLLAAQWCHARGIAFTALTVDHGLRAESAQEARQVAAWMAERGIAHTILTPAALPIPNLQARARAMRYAALTQWCHAHGATHLLLAHHADDQAETVLLQQHRGESPPSRAGMALVRAQAGIQLLRPLLGVRKRQLEAYLRSHDQPWAHDPSNASDAYARNRLRRSLSEETITHTWHAAQQQGALRHAQEQTRNTWLAQHASTHAGGVRIDRDALLAWPACSDALSHVLQQVGGKRHRPRGHETARLVEALHAPQGAATLGHCRLRWHGAQLTVAPEHPLEMAAIPPHIAAATSPKPLGKAPFWWFAYPPFDDGASLAAD
jgi:tRNA(Ile)-lysidine synthase